VQAIYGYAAGYGSTPPFYISLFRKNQNEYELIELFRKAWSSSFMRKRNLNPGSARCTNSKARLSDYDMRTRRDLRIADMQNAVNLADCGIFRRLSNERHQQR
jgi:hypothetical protein